MQTEDLEIIAQIKLGNTQVFEEIVTRYQTRIRAFCCNILSSQALGEEAAQESFIKAFQAINRYRPDAAFSTWLYRIARNHCIDILRKEKSSKWESLDALSSDTQYQPTDNIVSENVFEARDSTRKLLDKLPVEQREALIMREVYGMDYQEIAEVLSCSLDAVKGRIKRARANSLKILRHLSQVSSVSIDGGKNDE